MSSASDPVLDEGRFSSVLPIFLLLLLLEVRRGGGEAREMFYWRLCLLGLALEPPSSPPLPSSSLAHQQHGESGREKENNRGNGAREAGFKAPLTTDKQHRREGPRERRKPPRIGRQTRFGHNKMDSRVTSTLNGSFAPLTGFVFLRLGLRGRLETVSAT